MHRNRGGVSRGAAPKKRKRAFEHDSCSGEGSSGGDGQEQGRRRAAPPGRQRKAARGDVPQQVPFGAARVGA